MLGTHKLSHLLYWQDLLEHIFIHTFLFQVLDNAQSKRAPSDLHNRQIPIFITNEGYLETLH